MSRFLNDIVGIDTELKNGYSVLDEALCLYYESLDEEEQADFGVLFLNFIEDAKRKFPADAVSTNNIAVNNQSPEHNIPGLPILIVPKNQYVVKPSVYQKVVAISKQAENIIADETARKNNLNELNTFGQIIEEMNLSLDSPDNNTEQGDTLEAPGFDGLPEFISVFDYEDASMDAEMSNAEEQDDDSEEMEIMEAIVDYRIEDTASIDHREIESEGGRGAAVQIQEEKQDESKEKAAPDQEINPINNIYASIGFDDDDDDYLDDYEIVSKLKYKNELTENNEK